MNKQANQFRSYMIILSIRKNRRCRNYRQQATEPNTVLKANKQNELKKINSTLIALTFVGLNVIRLNIKFSEVRCHLVFISIV